MTPPTPFDLLETLARTDRAEVVRARRGTEELVLRLTPAGARGEAHAELAVLAAVTHPGLAGLRDHGVLPDGRSYVARDWIEGVTLDEHAEGLAPEEVGALVARLCPALHHLHERGFVHADLKPENVLVRSADGEPILTDYGMARAAGTREDAGVSGSFFAIAPEVLLGDAVSPRADLFALGVLLHGLLVAVEVRADEFYGRFPRTSYFEATGTVIGDLPEWAREVVSALLERDPARRPASALEVGRALSSRLGLTLELETEIPRLEVAPLYGRAGLVEELAGLDSDRVWVETPEREDAAVLARALALELALRGVRTSALDLGEELHGVSNGTRLDEFVLEQVRRIGSTVLVVSVPAGDRWALRAATLLSRALEQSGGGARIVVVGSDGDPGWTAVRCPELSASALEEFLAESVTCDAASELAARVIAACDGATSEVNRVLRSWSQSGALRASDRGLVLVDPQIPELGDREPFDQDADAARLLARLRVVGAPLDVAALGARLDGEDWLDALSELVVGGWVVARRGADETTYAPSDRGRLVTLDVDWPDLHAAEARWLAKRSGPAARVAFHEYCAEEDGAEAKLRMETRRLRERGAPELALRFLRRAAAESELSLELDAEQVACWSALGDAARTEEGLARLDERATTEPERALLERLRGQIAWSRHEYEEARGHYDRAFELEPRDGGQAVFGKAALFFATRSDEELDDLVRAAQRGDFGELDARAWINVRNLHAMSHFRRGRVELARDELSSFLKEARAERDAAHEAAVYINLGTVERRTGDSGRAIDCFERAEGLYREAGSLSGLAQARSQLGGLLREVVRLGEARERLESSLGLRERLGDAHGAAAVHGMLGLVHADAGELRAARDELEASARTMEQLGRAADAEVFSSRGFETSARTGVDARPDPRPASAATPATFEGDPRILLAHARTAWLLSEDQDARVLVRCASGLASDLGRGPELEEAQLLGRLVRKDDWSGIDAADYASPRVAQDAELIGLLARDGRAFNASRAHSLALELAHAGRIDRAARLHLAIARRSSDPALSESSGREAETLFEQVAAGLTDTERERARTTLLGIPDPWPADLEWSAEDEEERLDLDLTLFLEISRRMVAQQDLRTLLGIIVESALKVTGGTRGFLVLEENGELVFDTAVDSRRGDIDVPEVEISGSVVRRALEEGKPLRLSNAAADPLMGGAPSISAMELRSILCCPFEVERGLRGVIYVDHKIRTDAFGPRAEQLLEHLGDQAALAIRQVRRLEEIGQLNEQLTEKVAVTQSALSKATRQLREVGAEVAPTTGMVGDSPAMLELHKLLKMAATSDLAVLVQGASGTGKELAARALHELSPRASGPFVSENCAAIPETLIEAELFGYKKGAFTGADSDREGMFERANGGTIFLDEIGELPLEMQVKLLRVLETAEVRPLGDSKVKKVDFRIVTATNRDLEEYVNQGKFRADLLYRLDALRVTMPPLSDRLEDIPLLVEHFLRRENLRDGVERRVSSAVLKALCARPWPGNVRELSNEVSRLCVLSQGDVVDPSLVRAAGRTDAVSTPTKVMPLEQVERNAIENAILVTGGDKQQAAKLLGISQSKIYQRLAKWREEES